MRSFSESAAGRSQAAAAILCSSQISRVGANRSGKSKFAVVTSTVSDFHRADRCGVHLVTKGSHNRRR